MFGKRYRFMENEITQSMEDKIVSSEVESVETESSDDEEIGFEDLGLDEITLAAIEKKGFKVPSPIQVLAIPRLLNGDANVIAKARTGTGKTAAFGLPLVQRLRNEGDTVRAIILEPTRELAMQTATEMASFTTGRCPRTCVVYGGASMGEQIRSLKRGTEIVVGTPGRVQDLIDRGVLDISKIEYFILDEGDEMLDMGFVEDIEKIFSSANPECRVLLFSATIPKEILTIAQNFMGDYEIVEEENHEEAPLLIEQKYWLVRENEKIEALVRLIDISPDFFGLVFVQRKSDADYVSKVLDERGYEAAALHGDIPQGQREKILARFRNKKTRILVATDVAARGIDIEGLTHVVNYELPFDGPTYVHRIGRTGRAGSSGMALTLVRPEERRRLQYLQNAIRRSAKGEMKLSEIPSVEEVIEVKKTRLFDDIKTKIGLNDFVEESVPEDAAAEDNQDDEIVSLESQGVAVDSSAEENGTVEQPSAEKKVPHLRKGDPVFDKLAEELCSGQNAQEVIASLLAASYGKLLSKKQYGKISAVAPSRSERGGRDRDRGGRRGGNVAVGENEMRIYVQLGWHDGYNPKKIAGFFHNLLGVPDRKIDAIDMADKFCLLTLPLADGQKALAMSEKDKSLPHMHQDTKIARDFGGGRRDRGPGRGDTFRDRYRRDGSRERSFGGERRVRSNSHDRPRSHTATKRNSQAALYKKSNSAKEY